MLLPALGDTKSRNEVSTAVSASCPPPGTYPPLNLAWPNTQGIGLIFGLLLPLLPQEEHQPITTPCPGCGEVRQEGERLTEP